MKEYFKIYANCCRQPRPYQSITESELDDCIYHSIAMEDFYHEHDAEIFDDDGVTEAGDELVTAFFEQCKRDAEEISFYCGDYYVYIRDEGFNMYDIPRENV